MYTLDRLQLLRPYVRCYTRTRVALAALVLCGGPATTVAAQDVLGARVVGGRLEVVALRSNRVIHAWRSREGGMIRPVGFSPDGRYIAAIEWTATPSGTGTTTYPTGTLVISIPLNGRIVKQLPGAVDAAWLGAGDLVAVLGDYAETEFSYVGRSLVRVPVEGENQSIAGCLGPRVPHTATAVGDVYVMCTTTGGQRIAHRVRASIDSAEATTLLSSEVSPSGRYAIVRRGFADSTFVQDGIAQAAGGRDILAADQEPIGWTSAGNDILAVRPGARRPQVRPAPGAQVPPADRVRLRPRGSSPSPAEILLLDMRTGGVRTRFRGLVAPIVVNGEPVFTVNGRFALASRMANPN